MGSEESASSRPYEPLSNGKRLVKQVGASPFLNKGHLPVGGGVVQWALESCGATEFLRRDCNLRVCVCLCAAAL